MTYDISNVMWTIIEPRVAAACAYLLIIWPLIVKLSSSGCLEVQRGITRRTLPRRMDMGLSIDRHMEGINYKIGKLDRKLHLQSLMHSR